MMLECMHLIYKAIEYAGPAIEVLMPSRITL
jgi:hypothetical protein